MPENASLSGSLQEGKRLVKERFASLPGVVGFGVGNGTVRIYFETEDAREQVTEDSYKGFRLEKLVKGEPKLFSTL
jgi:hypothetical protein